MKNKIEEKLIFHSQKELYIHKIGILSSSPIAKLLSQPLSDTHSLALACLFGWRTPEELIEGSTEALVVQ